MGLRHAFVGVIPFALVALMQFYRSTTVLKVDRKGVGAAGLPKAARSGPAPWDGAAVEDERANNATAWIRRAQLGLTAVAGPSQLAGSAANSTAAAVATAPVATATAVTSNCPTDRKPYHTLLTATAQVYQQWQCRVMYFHWKKQRDADPKGACTELTGFTRLVASAGGRPDGLESEVPSAFVKEYTGGEAAKFHGYRVVNRPYSVVQFLKTAAWRSIPEQYLYIAETDHLLMHQLPNRASLGSPMAYVFGYMGANPAHASIVKNAWPEGGADGYKRVQPIGPSPVVIHRDDLEKIATPSRSLLRLGVLAATQLAGHLRLEAASYLSTAALWTPEQSYGRTGPAPQCSSAACSGAASPRRHPGPPIALPLAVQVERPLGAAQDQRRSGFPAGLGDRDVGHATAAIEAAAVCIQAATPVHAGGATRSPPLPSGCGTRSSATSRSSRAATAAACSCATSRASTGSSTTPTSSRPCSTARRASRGPSESSRSTSATSPTSTRYRRCRSRPRAPTWPPFG